MNDINVAMVRHAAQFYNADGIFDSRPSFGNFGSPDGYLTAAELMATIGAVEANYGGWYNANKGSVGPIIISQRYERMNRLVEALQAAIPEAQAAEARGEPGLRYMADEFYQLVRDAGFGTDEIFLAVQSDANLDGNVTFEEADRHVWFAEQTLKNPDLYCPEAARQKVLDALRPPEPEKGSVRIGRR